MHSTETEIEKFCTYLRLRNYSLHTVSNYAIDLGLFFAQLDKPVNLISWRDVDHFIQEQYDRGLSAATINRRLNAIKHFFEFLAVEVASLSINPVKPSHFLKQAKALPKKLLQKEVKVLFAKITNAVDRAMFMLMLRCGLRVSEIAHLKLSDIDWDQKALLVEQGKGRKDRWVYLSEDVAESLTACLQIRPSRVPGGYFFWNQKQKQRTLSIKAIQKKMERYAKKAEVKASCHSLRHTFASDLLEEGAEIISIKEFLGHESITTSERYARMSNQKVKRMYLQTIKKVIEKTKV